MKRWLALAALLALALLAGACREEPPAPPESPSTTVRPAPAVAGQGSTLAERFPPGKNCSIEAVRAAVHPHLTEVRRCYEEALRRDPETGGRLQLQIVVSEQGLARSVQRMESDFRDDKAVACIANVLEAIPYAPSPPGKPCTIVYPFDLQISEAMKARLRAMNGEK